MPIAAAFAVPLLASQPDVFIDRAASNVAVRDDEGRQTVVSGRRAKFTAEEWLERDGDARPLRDSARAGREGVWICADGLCTAESRGQKVGFMERKGDERQACAQGFAVLVAARRIDPCTDGVTVTAEDTARVGAMSLTFEGDDVEFETVRDHVGDRPWTVWAGR